MPDRGAYAGTLADGAADHSLTTSLYRSDDMARCIYRLRMDVKQPIDYSRFVILQIGADTYGYTRERQMAVGNEAGLVREWRTTWGGNCYRTSLCCWRAGSRGFRCTTPSRVIGRNPAPGPTAA